jgi:hypothetical protein
MLIAVVVLAALVVVLVAALIVQADRHLKAISALLARIETSPEIRVAAPVAPLSKEKVYISDEPYDDETWNNYVEPENQ